MLHEVVASLEARKTEERHAKYDRFTLLTKTPLDILETLLASLHGFWILDVGCWGISLVKGAARYLVNEVCSIDDDLTPGDSRPRKCVLKDTRSFFLCRLRRLEKRFFLYDTLCFVQQHAPHHVHAAENTCAVLRHSDEPALRVIAG